MKINEISLLGLLGPIWLALGFQFVQFLQPGSLLAPFGSFLAPFGSPLGSPGGPEFF
jgi:hypothetical protein